MTAFSCITISFSAYHIPGGIYYAGVDFIFISNSVFRRNARYKNLIKAILHPAKFSATAIVLYIQAQKTPGAGSFPSCIRSHLLIQPIFLFLVLPTLRQALLSSFRIQLILFFQLFQRLFPAYTQIFTNCNQSRYLFSSEILF